MIVGANECTERPRSSAPWWSNRTTESQIDTEDQGIQLGKIVQKNRVKDNDNCQSGDHSCFMNQDDTEMETKFMCSSVASNVGNGCQVERTTDAGVLEPLSAENCHETSLKSLLPDVVMSSNSGVGAIVDDSISPTDEYVFENQGFSDESDIETRCSPDVRKSDGSAS